MKMKNLIGFIVVAMAFAFIGCQGQQQIPNEPPKVVAVFPQNSESGVLVAIAIRVDFSEPIDCSGAEFNLMKAGDPVLVWGTTFCSGNSANFIPLQFLGFGSVYSVRISGVRDKEGKLAEDYQWEFKTATPYWELGQWNSVKKVLYSDTNVYIVGEGKNEKLKIQSRDINDMNKIIWSVVFKDVANVKGHFECSASLETTAQGDFIYILGSNGTLYNISDGPDPATEIDLRWYIAKINGQNGVVIWSHISDRRFRDTESETIGAISHNSSGVYVLGDRSLSIFPKRTVVVEKRDKQTGKIIWEKTKVGLWPGLLAISDENCYATGFNSYTIFYPGEYYWFPTFTGVYKFNCSDGAIEWYRELSRNLELPNSRYQIESPALYGNNLYLGGYYVNEDFGSLNAEERGLSWMFEKLDGKSGETLLTAMPYPIQEYPHYKSWGILGGFLADETGLYAAGKNGGKSTGKSTSMIQKYDHNLNLLWSKDLGITCCSEIKRIGNFLYVAIGAQNEEYKIIRLSAETGEKM